MVFRKERVRETFGVGVETLECWSLLDNGTMWGMYYRTLLAFIEDPVSWGMKLRSTELGPIGLSSVLCMVFILKGSTRNYSPHDISNSEPRWRRYATITFMLETAIFRHSMAYKATS